MKTVGLTLIGLVGGIVMGKLLNWGSPDRTKLHALAFLALPIWYPFVEEGGFRWPVWRDLPIYVAGVATGLSAYWWASRSEED